MTQLRYTDGLPNIAAHSHSLWDRATSGRLMGGRGGSLLLMCSLLTLPFAAGCRVEADDDDDMEMKIDTKGEKQGITIDKD
jgi:hypothetical protein